MVLPVVHSWFCAVAGDWLCVLGVEGIWGLIEEGQGSGGEGKQSDGGFFFWVPSCFS